MVAMLVERNPSCLASQFVVCEREGDRVVTAKTAKNVYTARVDAIRRHKEIVTATLRTAGKSVS